MTPARLLAVAFIYVCTAIAWSTLGASVVHRTGEFDERLAKEVAQLWGGHHNQLAPEAWVERPRTMTETVTETNAAGNPVARKIEKTVTDTVALPLLSSQLTVDLKLDHRRKGLLWYDTYAVAFSGRYRVGNPDAVERPVLVRFVFPSSEALYDSFVFRLNGQDVPSADGLSQGLTARALVPPGGEAVAEISYRSRGLGDWTYSFAPSGIAQVRDLSLTMTTDFAKIDFPAGTLSPSTKSASGRGWSLTWQFESLITGQKVGMDLPNLLNPGPVAARITFFAPVSLLFFIVVMVILGVVRGPSLHPMNYFLLSAAFFAFHLLLAYLVDHVNVHTAFLVASAVSLFLVVSYLRIVGGTSFALKQAGLAQLVFLVLFSYSFFFEGYTGLTITVGAVLTLFVLMQITARVDWTKVFERRE